MVVFSDLVLGVRIWIWIYLLSSFTILVSIIIYWQQERIKKTYFTFRFPEKVLKIIIHYKSGYYKTFYRLIPTRDLIKVDKLSYYYDKKVITKEHDFYMPKEKSKPSMIIVLRDFFVKQEGRRKLIGIGKTEQYNFLDYFRIKEKGGKYPEIHYVYNVPNPLKFDVEDEEIKFTSTQLNDFKQNDLIEKLLTMQGEKNLIMILLMGMALNIIITAFLLAKEMGWIT